MTLHGSASANLSPILFKGNNRSLGVNVIIHQDVSGSMDDVSQFYSNGDFIDTLQNALISVGIGKDITRFPNLYSWFGSTSRNPESSFIISNSRGTLTINQAFMRGELTPGLTKTNWTTKYFGIDGGVFVNICSNVIGQTTGGRFTGINAGLITEDVHGSIWSIYTSPNAISTRIPGIYGGIIGSEVRKGSTTLVITNSDEQRGSPAEMIDVLVATNPSGSQQRAINGVAGEAIFREYRIVALSTYTSSDGYDGVLFYDQSSSQPYGYVTFTGNTTYTITRSSSAPAWTQLSDQKHDTLTLASETRGGLFKINNVFTNNGVDYRQAFSNCLAEFVADTF